MNPPGTKPLDLDSLIQRVRDEAAAHTTPPSAATAQPPDTSHRHLLAPLPPELDSAPRPLPLVRFLSFHDETFVRLVYRELLRREPERDAAASYADRLNSGSLSKLDMIAAVSHSPEGRARGVPVPGLGLALRRERLLRLPIAGPLLRIAILVLRLPALEASLQRLESSIERRFAEVHRAFRFELIGPMEAKADKVTVAEMQRQTARIAFNKANREALLELERRVEALEAHRAADAAPLASNPGNTRGRSVD